MKISPILVLLVLVLSIGLVACGSNEAVVDPVVDDNSADTAAAEASGDEEITTELDEAFAEDDVEIGEII